MTQFQDYNETWGNEQVDEYYEKTTQGVSGVIDLALNSHFKNSKRVELDHMTYTMTENERVGLPGNLHELYAQLIFFYGDTTQIRVRYGLDLHESFNNLLTLIKKAYLKNDGSFELLISNISKEYDKLIDNLSDSDF